MHSSTNSLEQQTADLLNPTNKLVKESLKWSENLVRRRSTNRQRSLYSTYKNRMIKATSASCRSQRSLSQGDASMGRLSKNISYRSLGARSFRS